MKILKISEDMLRYLIALATTKLVNIYSEDLDTKEELARIGIYLESIIECYLFNVDISKKSDDGNKTGVIVDLKDEIWEVEEIADKNPKKKKFIVKDGTLFRKL